jgi:hypothetical protein
MRDVLLQLLHRSPFKPFAVTLTTDETYCIDDPKTVVLDKDLCIIFDPPRRLQAFAISSIWKTEIKDAADAH